MALPVELIGYLVLGGIVLLLLWAVSTGFLDKDTEVQAGHERMSRYQDIEDDDYGGP